MFHRSTCVIWAACLLLFTVFADEAVQTEAQQKGKKAPESRTPWDTLDDWAKPYGLEGKHMIGFAVVMIAQRFLVTWLQRSDKAKAAKEELAAGDTADAAAEKAALAEKLEKLEKAEKAARKAQESTADVIAKSEQVDEDVATDYSIGEVAELRFKMDPDIWVECKIVGKSSLPNHYKTEIDSDCHQDAYFYEGQTIDVSVLNLRKLPQVVE